MKIKIDKDLSVELKSLVRFEWQRYYPVLIVHERFEKLIKWILRILCFIGIATSVITIDNWYNSLLLSIVILLIEQFFERVIFEYTTLLIMPFPDFEIDYSQWKTNGFLLAQSTSNFSHLGPAYESRDYAAAFFGYLRSWNSNKNEDKENNIVVSFVLEPNERYTTYIYPNPDSRKADRLFKKAAKKNEVRKYGKRQQQLLAHMIFWHTLPFREGSFIKTFLQMNAPDSSFYLTPHAVGSASNPMESLIELSVLKNSYKLRRREELTNNDIEYHFHAAQ